MTMLLKYFCNEFIYRFALRKNGIYVNKIICMKTYLKNHFDILKYAKMYEAPPVSQGDTKQRSSPEH